MARPTTPHGAHHACDWNALPHELQVQILRRCDFLDKVRGEGVCKAWKKLLQDAQVRGRSPDPKIWQRTVTWPAYASSVNGLAVLSQDVLARTAV